KRDHAANVVAHLALVKPRRRDIPAEVGAKRCVAQYRGDPTQFIAILVHAGHLHRDHPLDRWREIAGYARTIAVVELRTPVVDEHRVDEVVRCENRIRYAWHPGRKAHRLLGGWHQRAVGKHRIAT